MSKWIGKVGQRIEVDITFKGYIYRPTWGDALKLFIMEDNDGNIFTLRSPAKFTVGQKWKLDGKVKRHHSFNGQKQTHIAHWGLMCNGKRN